MCFLFFFFFKQKTAYEMRISDWSSDVCSSDLWQVRLRENASYVLGDEADRGVCYSPGKNVVESRDKPVDMPGCNNHWGHEMQDITSARLEMDEDVVAFIEIPRQSRDQDCLICSE